MAAFNRSGACAVLLRCLDAGAFPAEVVLAAGQYGRVGDSDSLGQNITQALALHCFTMKLVQCGLGVNLEMFSIVCCCRFVFMLSG